MISIEGSNLAAGTHKRSITLLLIILFTTASIIALYFFNSLVRNQRQRNSSTEHRVALCITGNTRSFHYRIVHENILKHVVDPIRAEQPVDIFFNVKLTDDPRPGLGAAVNQEAKTRSAMEKFDPVLIHTLPYNDTFPSWSPSQSNGVEDSRLVDKPLGCNATFPTAMAPYALHRAAQCMPLIEKMESTKGIRYKWIYRTRPDVVFLDDIILPDEITNGTVFVNIVQPQSTAHFTNWWKFQYQEDVPSVGDHFMAAFREDAVVAMRAVEALNDCQLFNTPTRNSEGQLTYWLLTHGLKPEVRLWLWVVVRDDVGAECFRVKMFSVSNLTLHNNMINSCDLFKNEVNRSLELGN